MRTFTSEKLHLFVDILVFCCCCRVLCIRACICIEILRKTFIQLEWVHVSVVQLNMPYKMHMPNDNKKINRTNVLLLREMKKKKLYKNTTFWTLKCSRPFNNRFQNVIPLCVCVFSFFAVLACAYSMREKYEIDGSENEMLLHIGATYNRAVSNMSKFQFILLILNSMTFNAARVSCKPTE